LLQSISNSQSNLLHHAGRRGGGREDVRNRRKSVSVSRVAV
jgi:hypothetical protein